MKKTRNATPEEKAKGRDALNVEVVPAGEPFPLSAAASGFWFSDGTSIWLSGSCNHDVLFAELRARDDLDRPERECETLMALWETGAVRVLVKTDGLWKIDLRGYYEPVLQRFEEWFGWLGPDQARMTDVILDVVEKGTDVDLAYFQGSAEQAYAWMLMGCPHQNNRRPKTGGQGVCNNAVKPNANQVVAVLKAAGVPWAR